MAGGVAVVPASFIRGEGGSENADAARQVTERVRDGVRDAGRELVDEGEVTRALGSLQSGDEPTCRDRDCLGELVRLLEADDAVFVQVVERDEMTRDVRLVLARGEGATESRQAGFMVVLEDVRRLVALALKETSSAAAPASATADPVVAGAGEAPEEEPEYEPIESSTKPEKEGLAPTVFFVSAGVTSALVIGWIIVESVGYSRMKDLEDRVEDDDWEAERNDLKPLRAADGVLIGLAAAGAVTTAVLFFLTDFDAAEVTPAEQRAARLRLGPGGAGFTFEGRF